MISLKGMEVQVFIGVFCLICLIPLTLISLIFSILGYDAILDDAYINATKEEQKKMDKKAYRLQGAIISHYN